jgi:hypothetical protein
MSRGGRREGAGRPHGSGWRPSITNLRLEAVEQLTAIVGSDKDPLAVVVAMACDETLDRATRLGACSIALPYLYPKLSATTVQATHVTARIDAGELLDRIAERISRQSNPLVTVDGTATEPLEQVVQVAE